MPTVVRLTDLWRKIAGARSITADAVPSSWPTHVIVRRKPS